MSEQDPRAEAARVLSDAYRQLAEDAIPRIDAYVETVLEWAQVSPTFGSAMPNGSCNARVDRTVCGYPRRADGSCLNGHPAQPKETK